jgi:hypothetical protein
VQCLKHSDSINPVEYTIFSNKKRNYRGGEKMKSHVAFDTLAYANKLKEVGVGPKIAETQAEVTAEILSNLINDRLSTKDHLKDLEMKMYAFIFKAITANIAILGGLQTLFHFLK